MGRNCNLAASLLSTGRIDGASALGYISGDSAEHNWGSTSGLDHSDTPLQIPKLRAGQTPISMTPAPPLFQDRCRSLHVREEVLAHLRGYLMQTRTDKLFPEGQAGCGRGRHFATSAASGPKAGTQRVTCRHCATIWQRFQACPRYPSAANWQLGSAGSTASQPNFG